MPQSASTAYKSDGCIEDVYWNTRSMKACVCVYDYVLGVAMFFAIWLTMTLSKWRHKPPPTHTHTPTSGTLQKLEQITPLCACSDSDCCYIQIGFQVASCVRSAPWDLAWRSTHGDYYPSWRRPACSVSPLQIGPMWPSSSPQPSKHPFPPPIITVNHRDGSVRGLSPPWSGHSALSAPCAPCQCASTNTTGWASECSQRDQLELHT